MSPYYNVLGENSNNLCGGKKNKGINAMLRTSKDFRKENLELKGKGKFLIVQLQLKERLLMKLRWLRFF